MSQPLDAKENSLSFTRIRAGAARTFGGVADFSPCATSFAIHISPSV